MSAKTPNMPASKAQAGIIKLRLNLKTAATEPSQEGGGPSNISRSPRKSIRDENSKSDVNRGTNVSTRQHVSTKPHQPQAIFPGDRSESFDDAKRLERTVVGSLSKKSTSPDFTRPSIKIKVRLTGGDDAKPGEPEPKRKIVLSLKKPEDENSVTKAEGPIDIETVDKPAKKARPSSSAPKVKQVKAPSADAPSRAVKLSVPKDNTRVSAAPSPFSTIPAVAKAMSASGAGPSSNLALPHMRTSNLTRVPIAALSSLTTMTPVEREEERLSRQCLGETFGSLWPLIARPDVNKAYASLADLESGIMTYWLMLGPVDSAFNAPSLKPLTIPTSPGEAIEQTFGAQDREARILEEVGRLSLRFRTSAINTKNKAISSELLVLEQRLCLEEEKFLYAKLKSEYNKKVSELIQKKRLAEGSTANTATTATATTSAAANANTVPQTQQRILPRVGPSATAQATWTPPLGLQMERNSSSAEGTST